MDKSIEDLCEQNALQKDKKPVLISNAGMSNQ